MRQNGIWIMLVLATTMLNVLATNVYVCVPGGGAAQYPYTNWGMAATNIQDAVNAINTNGGNYVFISNGTYYLTNQIVITNVVILQSWHDGISDRTNTIIHGNNYAGKPVTNRCVYLAGRGATLAGFTITCGIATGGNWYACSGGGVFITNNGVLSDCIISSNLAPPPSGAGGGIFSELAVVTITNCVVIGNLGRTGGGVYCDQGTNTLRNCVIAANTQSPASGSGGGGVFMYGYKASNVIEQCVVRENMSLATGAGGGGITLRDGTTARNCLVYGNTAQRWGGGVYSWGPNNHVENCTIVSNRSSSYDTGGGLGNSDGTFFFVENTIIYYNTSASPGTYSNYYNVTNSSWTNCCTSPSLDELTPTPVNVGMVTNAPLFINPSATNFRLQTSSPCVNSGYNRAWMAGGLDLDGSRRIMMSVVDMGAYELAPLDGTIFMFR